MAQKRMFDKSITSDDIFLEMPIGSQLLYFHLSMNADDDGFLNNWKSIMKMIGAKEDDLKVLLAKSYILPFESGVIVIKHWKINNYLRNDRYKPTRFKEEASKLITDKNSVYQLYTNGIPSIDKNSIDKNSIDKNSNIVSKKTEVKKSYGNFKRIKLSDNELKRLIEDFGKEKIINQIKLLDEYVESNNNKNKYSNFNLVLRKSITQNWFSSNNKINQNKQEFKTGITQAMEAVYSENFKMAEDFLPTFDETKYYDK